MPPWEICPCTLADAPALARNNMSAFWTDPNWVIVWPKHITREYIIEQCTARMPENLLRDRNIRRHQKAVDPHTGALVGYARWELPATWAGTEWAEAQVADVGPEERAAIKERADGAWWEPIDVGGADEAAVEIKNRILAEKPYLSLDYLAVHPENKGKGVATALVETGMEKAKEMGVDIFILAFESALKLYLRLGFKEVDRVVEDESKWSGTGDHTIYLLTYEITKSQ